MFIKHSLFAVLVVRRKTFSFSVVSRRGLRNCSNLAKSIKSNTKQKLAKKVISKETPCTYQPLASELFVFKVRLVRIVERKVKFFECRLISITNLMHNSFIH